MNNIVTVLRSLFLMGILLYGNITFFARVSTAQPLDRKDRMRQMITTLSLTREQTQKLQEHLRNVNAQFETFTQIQHSFLDSLSTFKGEFDIIKKEEFREDPCPPECQRLKELYNANVMKMQSAYQRSERMLISLLQWLNGNMSEDKIRLIYSYLDYEIRHISQRGKGINLQHVRPREDLENPPYPRSKLPEAARETTAEESPPVPRLRKLEEPYSLSKEAVEKKFVEGSPRPMPTGPVSMETVLALFQGVPMNTMVNFLREIFVLTDSTLSIMLTDETGVAGTYSGHAIVRISDNIYKLESPQNTWHWIGCGIYWNGKIFGVGRFTHERTPGRTFMVHMEVQETRILSKGVYLTDDQGNLVSLPANIRVDQHVLLASEVARDISGTYSGHIINRVSDSIYRIESPPGEWHWNGCGIYWNNKIFGVGRFTNERTPGRAFMLHMEVSGRRINLKGIYLTDDQGNLINLPATIRVDSHVLIRE